ncbi:MAG: hypothetical protein MJ252_24455, partial [archaeon]|nr:hypothetical protein [archaeon]
MEKKTKESSKVTEEETSLKGLGILKSIAKIELSDEWKRSFKRHYEHDPPLGRRKVIMIDDNPSSEENQKLIEQIKGNSNFDLEIFTNIKDAYSYMKKDLIGEKEAKEEFDFSLIYYILNEKFAERFLDLYETEMEGFNLSPTNIIYCKDPEILKEKKATFDKLFNPGGIATQPEEIFKYLCMSQNSSLGEFFNKTNKGKVTQEQNGESYTINTKADLNSFILPSILGKIIQQNMIHKGSFDGFKEVIKSVCLHGISPIIVSKDSITQLVETYKLLNPSLNKRVDLPLYLYAKYFLKLIYSDAEIIKKLGALSSEELSKCQSVIALFYYALSQRYVKSYDGKLFGFGNFTEDKIKALQNKINKKDSSEETATLTFKSFQFYYSREDYLDDIMKAFEGNQKKGEFTVKFIINEKEEDSNVFLSIIDFFNRLEEGKNFKDTSALFLPFSIFEVDSIKKSSKGNYKYIIYLRYLDSYDKKINKTLREKDPEGILKEITKGNPEIAEFFGEDLNNSFNDYLKKKIILFLDTYSKNKYNKDLNEFGDDLKDYNILYSNTVKDALNTIKRFENKLIYTVINSKYFPSFMNEYKKEQNDINNILDNIILCENEEELRKAKGFEETNDKFYNPAGIAKDLKEAVDYILKEEPLKEGNKSKKEKKQLKDTFREIADPENEIIKTENPLKQIILRTKPNSNKIKPFMEWKLNSVEPITEEEKQLKETKNYAESFLTPKKEFLNQIIFSENNGEKMK